MEQATMCSSAHMNPWSEFSHRKATTLQQICDTFVTIRNVKLCSDVTEQSMCNNLLMRTIMQLSKKVMWIINTFH